MNIFSSILIKRNLITGFWALFLMAFFAVGLNSVVQVADCRVFPSSPKNVSSDRYLLATLGVPHASEQIQQLLNSYPMDAPIIFIAPNNKNASLTFCLIAGLALPRTVINADPTGNGVAQLRNDLRPSAVAFFQVPPPSAAQNKVQFGPLTFVRMERSK